jgi:alpha-maltose-1-phosphate synthase
MSSSEPASRGDLQPSVAINFTRDAFTTSGERLMGFQSAGESFLAALARHSRASVLGCFAANSEVYQAFDTQVRQGASQRLTTEWVRLTDPQALTKFGCLYLSGLDLPIQAWRRQRVSDNAYSICGLTHTIASEAAMASISDLVTAPVHPWDAVICTSDAVRASVLAIIKATCDHLGRRVGARRPALPEMPVIPLGVDAARFAARPEARQNWRRKLKIAEDEIAFVYFGRLNFVAKAHPLPMYLALERAAQRTGRRLTLIQAGWFATAGQADLFRSAARQYCPSVNCVFVDGRAAGAGEEIWHAGDVFISLSDNIQESFGLTPLEAMAAGLPVIVSDWDGYRQTVEHRKSGLAVPTALADEPAGIEIAWRFVNEFEDYNRYVGAVAQATAVDVEATAAACVELIENADLRKTLGAYGRRRANEVFDWRHIIGRYEELWTELARRRASAVPSAPGSPSDRLPPFKGNPMRLFAHYATRTVGDDTVVEVAVEEPAQAMAAILANQMNTVADSYLMAVDRRVLLLNHLVATGPQTMADLVARLKPADPNRLRRTVMWMLKCGIIRLR